MQDRIGDELRHDQRKRLAGRLRQRKTADRLAGLGRGPRPSTQGAAKVVRRTRGDEELRGLTQRRSTAGADACCCVRRRAIAGDATGGTAVVRHRTLLSASSRRLREAPPSAWLVRRVSRETPPCQG